MEKKGLRAYFPKDESRVVMDDYSKLILKYF
jgi:hypothetical protein